MGMMFPGIEALHDKIAAKAFQRQCSQLLTAYCYRISLTSVYQRRRSAAVTSCGQLTLIYCTSRGHGQVTVTEVLLYAARQSGTVCR